MASDMPFRATAFAAVLLATFARAGEKPAVVELFEDDTAAFIPQLTMGGIGGGEDVKIEAETVDVFAGTKALRVAPAQRFSPDIKGWDYSITQTPKAGEYRYLRFAWKKAGAGPLMIQFHTRGPVADWVIRYQAGPDPPWPAKVIAPAAPTEWQVVTRDLFADFGALSLGGIALTPHNGGDGLFDHILLGRTLEDLDRATAAAIMKTPPKETLSADRLKLLWEQLGNADPIVAETALWAMVRGHKEAMPYLLKTVTLPDSKAPTPVDAAAVAPLLADLTHYRHVTRAAASEELIKLGAGVLPHVRKACTLADDDSKLRLQAFIDDWSTRTGINLVRLRRCMIILRSVGTPEAKELLAKIAIAVP
jgi:hypothetical protein